MITSSDIQKILFEASNILQGIHMVERRDCLLRLLLFKRLSDISDNTKKQPFSVPIPWSEIEEIKERKNKDLAEALDAALIDVESANPMLEGVFTSLGKGYWSKFEKETLKELFHCFSQINLSSQNLQYLGALGDVCSDTLEWFASESRTYGDRYISHQVAQLIVKIMNPQADFQICDPVCGSGELLAECAQYIVDELADLSKVRLFGQEENVNLARIATINLILHGISNFNIQLGDVIESPKFVQNNALSQFDIVLTNPPFNLSYLEDKIQQEDVYQRFSYGIPSNGLGNLLFIQHIISSLKATGRAAVLMPHGVLSNRGEGEIRQKIIDEDVIEAIIGLPPKLFYNTTIPVVLMILNRSKSNKQKILFIDARNEYKSNKIKNLLLSEHTDRIIDTYRNFKTEENYSKIVQLKDIAEKGYDLSIGHYVILQKKEDLDIDQEVSELRKLEAERGRLEIVLDECLQALGIDL